jgi:predicted nuclease with TOPRIM domain
MNEQLRKEFEELLNQWKRNQQANILEGAEDEATLLEHRFYKFIEAFSQWFKTIDKPDSLEEALELPEIQEIVDQLPTPLYLPFENELDLLIDGIEQEMDEKYD